MVEKHLLRFCASVLDVHGIEIYANTYITDSFVGIVGMLVP